MDVTILFNSVMVLGFMVLIGVIIEWRLPSTERVRETLIFIVINIAIPAVVVQGIFTVDLDSGTLVDLSAALAVALMFNVIGLLLSLLIFRLIGFDKRDIRQFSVLTGIGNTGFVGIPLIYGALGASGALYASFYDVGNIIIVFTFVILLLSQESLNPKSVTKRVLNTPIITLMICVSLALLKFEPPGAVIDLSEHLSKLSGPLAMFYVGLLIPEIIKKIKGFHKYKELLLISAMRLLFFPLLFMGLILMLPVSSEVKLIAVIQTTMPSILLAPIFFKQYGYDEYFGAVAVIFTTLMALFTIPVILTIANWIVF